MLLIKVLNVASKKEASFSFIGNQKTLQVDPAQNLFPCIKTASENHHAFVVRSLHSVIIVVISGFQGLLFFPGKNVQPAYLEEEHQDSGARFDLFGVF